MSKKTDAAQNEAAVSASRRSFLSLAAVAAPAALIAGGDAAAAADALPQEGAAGLRKTEHVQKYLDSARF